MASGELKTFDEHPLFKAEEPLETYGDEETAKAMMNMFFEMWFTPQKAGELSQNDQCWEFLKTKDEKVIVRLWHTVKGGSRTVGMMRLHHISNHIKCIGHDEGYIYALKYLPMFFQIMEESFKVAAEYAGYELPTPFLPPAVGEFMAGLPGTLEALIKEHTADYKGGDHGHGPKPAGGAPAHAPAPQKPAEEPKPVQAAPVVPPLPLHQDPSPVRQPEPEVSPVKHHIIQEAPQAQVQKIINRTIPEEDEKFQETGNKLPVKNDSMFGKDSERFDWFEYAEQLRKERILMKPLVPEAKFASVLPKTSESNQYISPLVYAHKNAEDDDYPFDKGYKCILM